MRDPNQSTNGRNDRIIVVDDNEQIHADFRKILVSESRSSRDAGDHKAVLFGSESQGIRRTSFEVDSAYQGQQGFDMVCQALSRGVPYAMAFVDVRMPPGWDGIETVGRIWAEYPDLEVVICTAYSDYSWDEIAESLGQSDRLVILKKPFDNIEVRQLACALTEKWQSTHQAQSKLSQLEGMVEKRTASLSTSEARMRAIVESARECIISMNHAGEIIEFNPAAEATFGHTRDAVVGREVAEVMIPSALRQQHRHGLERYLATGKGPMLGKRMEVDALRSDGKEFPIELTVTAIQIDGRPSFTAMCHDIGDRRRMEERLRHGALHDTLTGLPNRALIVDRVENVIKRCGRREGYLFAVLFLDLDRFKNINDSLGHLAGDQLLIETSNRLRQCMRTTDLLARLGGDEFVVLVDDMEDETDALRVAERIHEALDRPFHIGGEELFTTASIGVTLSSSGYSQAEDMLRDADTAMYRAKDDGKACCRLFSAEMHAHAKKTLDLENDLRRAVEHGEFQNFYQPIFSLETGQAVGCEALMRWQHPQRGLIPPSDFLELMEDTGLILPVGWSLLREACCQLREWQQEFSEPEALTMSVNASPKQITQLGFVEKVRQIVGECGIDAQNLVLELTEDALIDDKKAVAATLSGLKEMGIRLAVDDFGTGYASLSYLHRFPFDTLKIDRSFVSPADNRDGHWQIVQSIIGLAHNLDMVVVAEGVETEEQQARLAALNCDRVQGYLFAHPMNDEEMLAFLTVHRPALLSETAVCLASSSEERAASL